MNKLQQRSLEEARAYILHIIGQFAGLGAEVAPRITSDGRCYAVVPEDASLAHASEFVKGWLTNGQTCADWLQCRVEDYAAKGRTGVVIVQDLSAELSDHAKYPPGTDWWTDGRTVYMWTEFGLGRDPQIKQLLREPISFQVALFLVDDSKLADELRLGKGNVRHIASNVFEMYITAYDRDGFVMWAR